jgi:hypothetical protein
MVFYQPFHWIFQNFSQFQFIELHKSFITSLKPLATPPTKFIGKLQLSGIYIYVEKRNRLIRLQ